jgi:predicted transposase YbfD/YdcC
VDGFELLVQDDWSEVVEWAEGNEDFLLTLLPLPYGLPSEDTYRRVFQRIDPVAFEECFLNWTGALARALPRQVAFISSLGGCDAQQMAAAVRGRWGVENQLHWRLDMSYRDGESRPRAGHGAHSFSRLRRIVLNKLKADPRPVSLKAQRYRCSIDRK